MAPKKKAAPRLTEENVHEQAATLPVEAKNEPVVAPKAPIAVEQPVEAVEPITTHRGKGDYLWPYEYNKETGRPYFQVPGAVYVAPPAGSKAEAMKFHLLAQPRVRMMIGRDPGERPGSNVLKSFCRNGYRLDFPKMRTVELPEDLADKVAEQIAQTEHALAQDRISGNPEKEAAL